MTAHLTDEDQALLREFVYYLQYEGFLITRGVAVKGFAAWRAKQAQSRCLECKSPATWRRRTQFSGDHPYCDKHARRESDFGQENPSYFYWEAVPAQKTGTPP
jgi:hypothetical protein